MKQKLALKALHEFGLRLYEEMQRGEFPSVKMPSRSIKNITYDPKCKQFVLGEKFVKRDTRYVKHLRPFSQLVWVADFSHMLIEQGKTSTLRDVYYSSQAYGVKFKDQFESDEIITDLETILGIPREDFNIFPEERSAIFGDLEIEYTVPGYEGKRLNLTSHPDGVMIGPALATCNFVRTSADKVIVIEKGAMFTRLIEERAHEKFKALLVHTAGQAPRSTRKLLHRLNEELSLPIYIFTDADAWGIHIAMVIIAGSINSAHLRDLVVPEAKWLGVWATDIEKYKLPTEKMTDKDIKRLHELLKDPRYSDEFWRSQIETFLKLKRKCELEAFSRYGLSFVVDRYLPEKLGEANTSH